MCKLGKCLFAHFAFKGSLLAMSPLVNFEFDNEDKKAVPDTQTHRRTDRGHPGLTNSVLKWLDIQRRSRNEEKEGQDVRY